MTHKFAAYNSVSQWEIGILCTSDTREKKNCLNTRSIMYSILAVFVDKTLVQPKISMRKCLVVCFYLCKAKSSITRVLRNSSSAMFNLDWFFFCLEWRYGKLTIFNDHSYDPTFENLLKRFPWPLFLLTFFSSS